MFNPNFDPLSDLQQLINNQEVMSKSLLEVAKAFNDRADVINQLVNQVNLQNAQINNLADRIQLLERS
jgi:hypothetical protein